MTLTAIGSYWYDLRKKVTNLETRQSERALSNSAGRILSLWFVEAKKKSRFAEFRVLLQHFTEMFLAIPDDSDVSMGNCNSIMRRHTPHLYAVLQWAPHFYSTVAYNSSNLNIIYIRTLWEENFLSTTTKKCLSFRPPFL